MTAISLAQVRNRIERIRENGDRLRSGIFDRNQAEERLAKPISDASGRFQLHWRFGSFGPIDYEVRDIESRRLDCAVFMDGKKVMAADFLEFRARERMTDHNFFWGMDAPDGHTCEIGMAYLSAWGAKELNRTGNFAVLDHLATRRGTAPSAWGPLLNEFIEKKVLRTSFAVIADPYPHDVVDAMRQAGRPDEEQDLSRMAARRHEAKFRFCKDYLGFTKFGDEARLSDWMYRSNHGAPEPDFKDFDTGDIGNSIRNGRKSPARAFR